MGAKACCWGLLVVVVLAQAATGSLEIVDKKLPCHRGSMRKTTAKLIKETPFAGLFPELRNSTVFEASAVTRVRGRFYVVFDNAMSIGYLDSRFQFRDPENKLIGDWEPESQFEGIAYVPESDTFLLLHESWADHEAKVYKPLIREVKISKDMASYETLAVCEVDFELTHENKGFESLQYLHTKNGAYLLGMCEGNHCKGGEEGRDSGNGRIVVSQLKKTNDGGCVWEVDRVLDVPPSADFADFAGMAYNYETGKLAVLSQEEAAIWVGDFDADALKFRSQEGQVFHLPRNNHCQVIYCNAEGISWVDNYRIVVASDKAKSTQPFWCDAKDQSIHLFAMPRAWDPYEPAELAVARYRAEVEAEEAAAEAAEL